MLNLLQLKNSFYPYGANKDIGSTNIINKKNKKEIIHLDPGSWMMFENNVVEHQAYSHFKVITRPTIEIDIMADFETDTTLNFNGIKLVIVVSTMIIKMIIALVN